MKLLLGAQRYPHFSPVINQRIERRWNPSAGI